MFRSTIFLLLLFATSICLFGQSGVVTTEDGKTTLVGATIYAVNNELGTISGGDGSFSLALTTLPDTLIVSYLGYQQATIPVNRSNVLLSIRLLRQSTTLPDITVKAYREPEMFSPSQRSILDFLIFDKKVLTIIHSTRAPNYRLQLSTLSGELLHELPVEKPRPEGLFAGCLGGVYLLYETAAVELHCTDHAVSLREKNSRRDFDRFLKPCMLADRGRVYTGYHRHKSQIFQLFSSSEDGGGSVQIAEIYNEDLLRRLSEETFFKANKARTLGGLPGAEQMIANMYIDEQIFADRVIYQPVNAQLFSVAEELLLFDFANHRIRAFYPDAGRQHREVPFIFHQRDPFGAQILQDDVSGKLYTISSDHKYTYVHAIAPRTGMVEEVAIIPAIYLKNIQIHDGILYYLHKGITFEDRWRYLYRVNVD